jgi:WD40 repeat protein
LLLGGAIAAIVVIIRDKEGKEIARLQVPEGGDVKIEDDGKAKGEARKPPAPEENGRIEPVPLAPPLPGEPLSPVALVQRPAKLPGVRSWSIETRNVYYSQAMAYRPDGKRLAVACNGGVFRIWEPESGRLVQVLLESSAVGSMAWSPDGRVLALGCQGKQPVRLFDAETGRFLRALGAPVPNSGSALAWSEDGRTLRAKMHSSTECHTWNASDGKLLGTVQIPCVNQVFSPNGKQLAGQRGDGRLAVWDVETGKEVRPLGMPLSRLEGIAWSPKGDRLASIDAKGLHVWNVESGEESFTHAEVIGGGMTWSPDGKTLAKGGPDHTVDVWDDGGQTRIKLSAHQSDVWLLAWSPDGKRLASFATGEKRILLWDAAKGELQRELGPLPATDWNGRQMIWSPDGRLLAFPVHELGWHFWDVEQNKLVNNPKEWTDQLLVFSPDGRSALVGSYGTVYRLRDRTTGKEIRSLPVGVMPWGCHPVWSPDGRRLAVPVEWGVELWRGDLSRRVRTLPVAYVGVLQVAFSADVKLTISQAGERLHVWETDTGQLRGILLLGEKNNGLTIAAGGHYTGNDQAERGIVVVVQKDGGTQELLEPADFEQKYGWKNAPDKVHLLQALPAPLSPLPGMPMGPLALVREPAELPNANSWTIETVHSRGSVNAVAYRPDGKRLAAGGEDGTIRIWDTTSGELVRMLVGGDRVGALSWSKDGHALTAVRPNEGEGREWDADTGRLLRRVSGAVIPATKTAPSPDGRQTATADEKGVRLNDAATDKLLHTLAESYAYGAIFSLNWSPDGQRLAAGTNFGALRVVEAATGLSRPGLAEYERAGAWSPDGKTFAAFGHDNRVHLLDSVTHRLLRTLEGDGADGIDLAWTTDGKLLAGGAHSGARLVGGDRQTTVAQRQTRHRHRLVAGRQDSPRRAVRPGRSSVDRRRERGRPSQAGGRRSRPATHPLVA